MSNDDCSRPIHPSEEELADLITRLRKRFLGMQCSSIFLDADDLAQETLLVMLRARNVRNPVAYSLGSANKVGTRAVKWRIEERLCDPVDLIFDSGDAISPECGDLVLEQARMVWLRTTPLPRGLNRIRAALLALAESSPEHLDQIIKTIESGKHEGNCAFNYSHAARILKKRGVPGSEQAIAKQLQRLVRLLGEVPA